MATNPAVDAYLDRSRQWADEIRALRPILVSAGLSEELKWGKPCYCHGGKNIAIVQEMKGFLSLMFFKGALLDDPAGVLRDQGPNSRSARRIELTSTDDVARLAATIAEFVDAAIDVEDAGIAVGPAPEPELVAELQARIDTDPAFRAAFESLTPGRRREYNLMIGEAKQSATRAARVEKYADRILAGKGLRDQRSPTPRRPG